MGDLGDCGSGFSNLGDSELTAKLRAIVGDEHAATIGVLDLLNEVERRGVHLRDGFPSLFGFCTARVECGGLGYAETAANRRIRAARLIRRYPECAELIKARRVSVSAASAIYSVISRDNQAEILKAAQELGYRALQEFLVRFQDPRKRAVADRVEAVVMEPSPSAFDAGPMADAARISANGPAGSLVSDRGFSVHTSPGGIFEGASEKSVGLEVIEKLKITFGAERQFMGLVQRARTILSGKYPKGASLEDIFREALSVLIERGSAQRRVEKRAAQAGAKDLGDGDNADGGNADGVKILRRKIPAAVRDLVFLRDEGKCSYVAPSGQRCGATWDLEIDHIRPFSMGGDHSVENLRVLCRGHNQWRNGVAGPKF